MTNITYRGVRMCQPKGVRCPSSAKKSLNKAVALKNEYTGDDPSEKRRLQSSVRKALREYHLTTEGQKMLRSKIEEAQSNNDTKMAARLQKELDTALTESAVLNERSKEYRASTKLKKNVTSFVDRLGDDGIKPLFKKDGTVLILLNAEESKLTEDTLQEELKKSRLSFVHVQVLKEKASHWANNPNPFEMMADFNDDMRGRGSLHIEPNYETHARRMKAYKRIAELDTETEELRKEIEKIRNSGIALSEASTDIPPTPDDRPWWELSDAELSALNPSDTPIDPDDWL